MIELRLGFDLTMPETEATAQAVAEWRAAHERAGRTPAGEPHIRVVRDDPARAAVGEYLIEVGGRGDQ